MMRLMVFRLMVVCVVVQFMHVAPLWAQTQFKPRVRNNLFTKDNWRDGKAEILIYHGREILARSVYVGKLTMITEGVAGPAAEKKRREKRPEKDWLVHMQTIKEIPTGVSVIHQNLALVATAAEMLPVSVVCSTQQWGDLSWKSLDYGFFASKAQGRLFGFPRQLEKTAAEFFDLGELQQAIPYEALPLFLRALDFSKPGFDFAMMEPLTGPWLRKPRLGGANVKVGAVETTMVTGKEYQVRLITVDHFLGEDRFWFQVEPPKVLMKWTRYNGSEYLFRKRLRTDYWNKRHPLDAMLIH